MSESPQLPLFSANSTTSSTCEEASSPASNEPGTSSNDPSTNTPDGATRSGPTRHVTGSCSSDGVDSAATPSPAAKNMAGFDPQRTLSIFTAGRITEASTLTIPRPTTRAECLAEARPCPWVGCRHHLLLEVTSSKLRPSSLRLNVASKGQTKIGRRPALRSSAAAEIVRAWIDDAIEHLSRMRFTCTLDVVDYYEGEELPDHVLALLLGTRRQYINMVVRDAVHKQRTALAHFNIIDVDEQGRVLGTIGEQGPTFDGTRPLG